MPAFRYKALDADGKLVKGLLEGDSDRHVRALLRERSLRPVAIDDAKSIFGILKRKSRSKACIWVKMD